MLVLTLKEKNNLPKKKVSHTFESYIPKEVKMKNLAVFTMLVAVLATASPAFSWGVSNEEMHNTGFSPEIVRIADLQRSRMEDMVPIPPERTRWQQFWWNIYHNDTIGSTYPFGQTKINF